MKCCLKPNGSADHSAKTGAARPATADLAFSPNVSVWATNSDTAGAAVAVVVGVERTRETCGRSARIGIGELECLHRRERAIERGFKERFMILMEKIVLC
jgi:hypothetical protein